MIHCDLYFSKGLKPPTRYWYSRDSATLSWRESLTTLFGVIWSISLGVVICHDPCTFQEIIHPKHTLCCFWLVHRKCQRILPPKDHQQKNLKWLLAQIAPNFLWNIYLMINGKVFGVSHAPVMKIDCYPGSCPKWPGYTIPTPLLLAYPSFNSSHLKMDGWNTTLTFWTLIFSGAMLVLGGY